MLVLLGFYIVSDYGVTYDEYVNRRNGGVSLNYIATIIEKTFNISIFSGDQALAPYRIALDSYQDRDYGVAFDLPALVLERVLQINNVRDQYLLRHILTYLFFLVGCWALYKTVLIRFSSQFFGVCSVAMMILSPRIFADSFYNSKDIVFMSAAAIATYAMQRLFDKKDVISAAYFALATAFAINIRIIAIIFPIALATIVLFGLLTRKQPLHTKVLIFYVVVATVLTITFWPWLWTNPTERFMLAFSNMSKFRWEGWVLYLGNYYSASDLPRHYLMTWIAVSTPIFYLVLFAIGTLSIIKTTMFNKFLLWKSPEELQDLVFFGLFFSPLILVFINRPVLYDGWRQFYFVYPAFICIAIRGLTVGPKLLRHLKIYRFVLVSFFCATLIYVGSWMVTNHPFQNLYFNALATRGATQSFELDYWGTSNTRVLRYLLQYKPTGTLRIWSLGITAVTQSLVLLDEVDKNRIEIVNEADDAEFIVTNFRFITPEQRNFLRNSDWLNIYNVVVDQRVISGVFEKITH